VGAVGNAGAAFDLTGGFEFAEFVPITRVEMTDRAGGAGGNGGSDLEPAAGEGSARSTPETIVETTSMPQKPTLLSKAFIGTID